MDKPKIIAYDLGTSGNKASLYDVDGNCLSSVFEGYRTYYSQRGWHEQKPDEWWEAVVKSTHRLLQISSVNKSEIECVAISGHSLGAVPIDNKGNLLREKTPIWSDTRAHDQVKKFFKQIDYENWYMTTGNGFPPACYAIFKIMWYKDHETAMYDKIFKVLGTKDFINFKMTGNIMTDYSYASGCGAYNLEKWDYADDFIEASGVRPQIFPVIVPSTAVVGLLSKEASEQLGLPQSVKVLCGGVDNSCMAVGAKNIGQGRIYTSLGSSAWIAVSSDKPVLDTKSKPFVFAHVIPKMFTSAVSIFSAGSSYKWIKDTICSNLKLSAKNAQRDPYNLMEKIARGSTIGANRLIFNPSLAGGTSLDPSPNIRGSFIGLDLRHTQADLIRAALEGIAMNLKLNLDVLKKFCHIQKEMVLVGGGSKSDLWRQIFADVYEMNVVKTNVDQETGSLGAAAIAAVGSGLWDDFNKIDKIVAKDKASYPIEKNSIKYRRLLKVFESATKATAAVSDMLNEVDL